MPRFIIPINEKKRQRKKLFAWLYAIVILGCLIITIFFESKTLLLRVGTMTVLLNAIWSVWTIVNSIRDMGKIRFAELNEDHIEWAVQ